MALFAPNAQFLSAPAPSRNRSQRSQRPRDDVDEFLSSDLELSFASTMSLHSPPHAPTMQIPNNQSDLMDVSPALANPVLTFTPPKDNDAAKHMNRPRAFTGGARTFGRDVSNSVSPTLPPPLIPKSGGSTSHKRTQRSALPYEWMAVPPAKLVEDVHSKSIFAVSIYIFIRTGSPVVIKFPDVPSVSLSSLFKLPMMLWMWTPLFLDRSQRLMLQYLPCCQQCQQ